MQPAWGASETERPGDAASVWGASETGRYGSVWRASETELAHHVPLPFNPFILHYAP